MVQIKPFKGLRYNLEKIGDIKKVTTEPYDKISPDLQKKYYAQSPYNFCRIILGLDQHDDNQNQNKYQRAKDDYTAWCKEGILLPETTPSIYLYEQTFSYEGSPVKSRKAFISMVKIEESPDVIRPHENTLSGPKADRLQLLKATQADLEQIFVLYADEQQAISVRLADAYSQSPLFTYTDDLNVTHKFWQVTDTAIISHIQQEMKNKDLFIADGHHRYETYINYKKEQKTAQPNDPDTAAYNYCMMTFVAMEDPGLTILPTHRMVKNLTNFDSASFLEKLNQNFELKAYNQTEEHELLTDLKQTKHAFGLAVINHPVLYLIKLKTEDLIDKHLDPTLKSKDLDVSILHKIILEDLLGIDKEKLALQTNVFYKRSDTGTLREVKNNNYQLGFILNATGINQVKDVARAGEKMPQKSTDFYPKIASGLVLADISAVNQIS